ASYPFSKYNRVELNVGGYAVDRARWVDYDEANNLIEDYRAKARRRVLLPELAYIHDTVLWGSTGPINGSRYRFSYAYSPDIGQNGLVNRPYAEFYTLKGDIRSYFRLGNDYSWASRVTGGISDGPDPQNFFLGGVSNWINRRFENNQIPDAIDDFYFSSFIVPFRGADYFEKRGTGNRFFLVNQEFRYPMVESLRMRWPLPLSIRDIRGVLFTDVGAAWDDNTFKLTAEDEMGKRRLADLQTAYGFGMRSWLGFFVLRWDVAWATDGVSTTQPRYYFSIGAEY
ncbi:MAG: BamA/TamA family outer membrane protein, partial [bacterium]|nr:BamA/TamA family outer membrane protein [bacterium]